MVRSVLHRVNHGDSPTSQGRHLVTLPIFILTARAGFFFCSRSTLYQFILQDSSIQWNGEHLFGPPVSCLLNRITLDTCADATQSWSDKAVRMGWQQMQCVLARVHRHTSKASTGTNFCSWMLSRQHGAPSVVLIRKLPWTKSGHKFKAQWLFHTLCYFNTLRTC